MVTNLVFCFFGILFMFMAFFTTGLRGARSKGPYRPISKAGRIILFLGGTGIYASGAKGLSSGWHAAVPYIAVVILLLFLNSKRIRPHIDRALRSDEPLLVIDFIGGLPPAMIVVRIAFLLAVAAMLVFGVAPVSDATARVGIIACVLALFVIFIVDAALESHYVNSGRATQISVPPQRTEWSSAPGPKRE